jgi:predicted nuclease of predicted toxin-antitoxin system
MKLLLDECMPRRFGRALLREHEVETIQSMRWRGLKNGALLSSRT